MPTVKYITNGNWVAIPTSGAIATDTTYGYVKLATQADVAAGTSNSAVVTAKQLKDYSDGNFVHLTGNEEITGNKTFTGITTLSRNGDTQFIEIKNTSMEQSVNPSTSAFSHIRFKDKNNDVLGELYLRDTSTERELKLYVKDTTGEMKGNLVLGCDSNNSGYVKTDTHAASDSTTLNHIPTIGWVNNPDKSLNVVHRSGDETIAGVKTFVGDTILIKNKSTVIDTTTNPSQQKYIYTDYIDKNNVRMGVIGSFQQADGKYGTYLQAGNEGMLKIISDGTNITTSAPTPPASDNSTQIATTAWCYDPTKSTNLVHRTGDETIGGNKTFSNTIQGTAYRALWGDLAEYYLTDAEYPKGTLVQFGGEKEITIAKNKVNAVITSEPGFILNSNMENSQAIALIGRVPVRVIGKVNKFDKIALSYIDGIGCVNNDTENPIGIALESKADADEGLIICSVKIDLV